MGRMDVANNEACTTEHEFVLVLSGIANIDQPVMDALFEAGCDDATPSLRFGRVYLTFAREAPSMKEAIFSAIRDVRRAKIGADVVCIDECDYVTQAEIARRIKRSRQLVGQYVAGTRGPGNFPPPTCDIAEGYPLWRWCEVSYWFWQNGIIEEHVLRDAKLIAMINLVLAYLQQQQQDSALAEEVFLMAMDRQPEAVG